LAPLKSQLARLLRTVEKVRAEASRGQEAEQHRVQGELLSQNLASLKRGMKEARLTRFTPEGPVEVRVPLDPRRSPKEEAEWHFHQYRRLLRGVEHATSRLRRLEEERAALEERIAVAGQLEIEAGESPGPVPVAKTRAPGRRTYREYLSSTGRRIFVGKGGADNDALTFKFASPSDLWLHVRGLPGAHVVVPLGKGEAVSQELLLDAAHLALHHSESKGEPKAEVSYTHVKFVKKVKGGSPGQVTYTREKTLLLRLEPHRLEYLLRREQLSFRASP
jgi:predicted ribosome quality control (RQC) complex YloA/Tae2 family protein